MKIAHVFHNYYPVVGGLERAVQSLAEELAKMGHEVHVITSRFGAEKRPKEEVINGVYVHRVKALWLRFPDLTYPLEFAEKVLRDADIVHGHSQNSLFTVKLIEKAKKLGIKTVMYFMAIDAFNDHPDSLVRLIGPYYARYVIKGAIALSDIKLVRSLRDQEILSKKYGVEAILIPDGVPEWFLSHRYCGDEFRRRYGIDRDYALYVGRLHPLKGVDILIKALYHIVKTSIDLKLVILGPGDAGPHRELAQKLNVDKNVFFLGFVDEEIKICAIDGSLAVVVPSVCDYVEVYPMIISEAWARSKPIIVTRVGGIPYRVKHMVNGLLVPPKDPKALAEAMIALLQNKELVTRLGAEGRKEIITWSEVATKMLSIYKGYA
ncbi:MAG: glycosyltransferase family 4 protein [Thermosphaera aggregans]|jgi:glycosyltransferase involved in cell wall biosynthesis|uniref:glycosyltransferase family 4 protein n=1 Tax=Thermosphaera aggregans TaxID=54254 RepID=UPI003C11F9C5